MIHPSEDYVLRTWEVEDGLPTNTVQSIAQMPDGYLWLATGSGIVRFDGVRFTVFTKADGLNSDGVQALHVSRSGELWIGLDHGGVMRLRDGCFETVLPVAEGDPNVGFVTAIAEDASGAMWIGFSGEKRVVRWSNGKLTTFGPDEGIGSWSETAVYAENSGRIWLGTKDGFAIFDGARFRPMEPDVYGGAILAPAHDGGMWVVHQTRLLRCSSEGEVRQIADLSWLGGGLETKALFEDEDHVLWLATRGAGLYRFSAGQFFRVPTSHTALLALGQTRDGSLWAGTRGGGLNRVSRRQFFLRTVSHGLGKDVISSIAYDAGVALWICPTDSAPVRAISPQNDYFAAVPGWTAGAPVITSFADRTGQVWFGLDGGGVIRWNGDAYERLSFPTRIESVFAARDGTWWIAAHRGALIHWKDDEREEYLSSVRAIGEDESGAIWAGTTDGRIFRREGVGTFVPLPLPEGIAGHGIRFFLGDGAGTMWIGTQGGGLVRWRRNKQDRVTAAGGLLDDDVKQMLFDRYDRAWIASSHGLSRVSRADLEAVLDGKSRTFEPTTFGRDDGLPNLGFTSGNRNASVRTPDGHIWMATNRGALEIAPQAKRLTTEPPRVIIEEMLLCGKHVPLRKGVVPVVPPRSRQFEIRYTVPRFLAPERLQFRYRLEGFDEEWTNAGNTRSAIFARLPPGVYHLEIASRELAGGWSTAVATLPFVIRAAWWETPWLPAAVIVMGAGVLIWLVRWIVLRRVRVRMQRLEQETALERERARIARDLHDQVGAHLTQISLLAELATTPERRRKLGDTTRQAADALDIVVWAADPRKDSLSDLFYHLIAVAEDFLSQAGVSCRIEIPAEMPQRNLSPEFRHHVLLVVKEALNNAVKYAAATEIELGAELSAQTLAVWVKDNGCGFEMVELPANGNGLVNMRERAKALSGECRIDSHPAAGTRISLIVPWPQKC